MGSEPIQALAHFEDTLVTQEKYSRLKSWAITNSGYVKDRELDTENSSFCRFDFDLERNILAVPRGNGQVEVLDGRTFEQHQLLSPSDDDSNLGSIMTVKLTQISDKWFVIGGYESGICCLWDLDSGKVMHQLQMTDSGESPMTIDYDPGTNRGLVGGSSDKIAVFSIDRQNTKIVKKTDISIKNQGVNRIQIRADQKVFASGGWDGKVRVFSWKSLRPLAVLTEHKRNVLDLIYSPGKVELWNSPIMATAGEDGQIALWDLYN